MTKGTSSFRNNSIYLTNNMIKNPLPLLALIFLTTAKTLKKTFSPYNSLNLTMLITRLINS